MDELKEFSSAPSSQLWMRQHHSASILGTAWAFESDTETNISIYNHKSNEVGVSADSAPRPVYAYDPPLQCVRTAATPRYLLCGTGAPRFFFF